MSPDCYPFLFEGRPLKLIDLTQGKVALVDDEDYESLRVHKWYARRDTGGKVWYAVRKHRNDAGVQKDVLMHREILKSGTASVDHRNGDGLDNRRENLRFATHSQNAANARLQQRNTSGYKGVYWDKVKKKWIARVVHEGKYHYVGAFEDRISASIARDKFAKQMFGEFASLNKAA